MTAQSRATTTPGRGRRERSTKQYQAVLDELAGASDFRSAQDIHAGLRARGASVGLATVYRALQAMVEGGAADSLRTDSGEAVYRSCESSSHHHHLVCRECNATVEVAGPAVERWTANVADEHGFTDVSHTVELFGICPACQAQRNA